jgi:hypothetical protein
MDTAQSDPVPADPTPQPVMTVEWWKATVTSLALLTVSVLTAFGTWTPTQEQITAVTAAGAGLIAILFPLIAYFVHNRVTPVATANRAITAALYTPVPTDAADEAFLADRKAKRDEAQRQLLGLAPTNTAAAPATVVHGTL